MNRFVLIGPPQIGKSVAAHRIARALGYTNIIYEWDGQAELPDHVLAVANCEPNPFSTGKGEVVFMVNSSIDLQTLVEALESRPAASKIEFTIAKQLADIACWLDCAKAHLPADWSADAAGFVNSLHDSAEYLARDRQTEIYARDDSPTPTIPQPAPERRDQTSVPPISA